MKKVYLFILLGILALNSQVNAQWVVFNDPIFKSALVGDNLINTDSDTNISLVEAVAFTGDINIIEYGVYDLTGIEEFINLTGLYASDNYVTTADLSQNTLLETLMLSNNNLATLDLSANTSLEFISLYSNELTSIILPQTSTVTTLDLSVNLLTSVDLSGYSSLVDLYIYDNQLTSLNLNNCWALGAIDCYNNQLTCIDAGDCYALTYLDCTNNPPLTAVNVKNGNNTNMGNGGFMATSNPLLTCIQVDDASYSSSSWTNIPAGATFSIDCGQPTISYTYSTPLCIGSPITFTSTATNTDTYSWNFDDGNTSTVANPSHTYDEGGYYMVEVYASNCYGSVSSYDFLELGSSIHGEIIHTPTITQGFYYLLEYNSTYGVLDTIDSGYLEGPMFDFQQVPQGQYIILVVPDTSQYPGTMPMFHYDSPIWDWADVLTIGCSADTNIEVIVQDIVTLPVGSGVLHGSIIEGPGFGRAQGDPIHGVDVKLGITSTSQIVGVTTTDTNGEYSFGLVPFGTYTIFVNIPGLLRDSSYVITVDSSNYQYLNLDYIVDSNSIYIVNPLGVEDGAEATEFNVFPNPATDNIFVSYELSQGSKVKLEMYNLMGVQLSTYINADQPAGKYVYQINPMISQLGSGIYLATLTVNGKTTTRKIILTE